MILWIYFDDGCNKPREQSFSRLANEDKIQSVLWNHILFPFVPIFNCNMLKKICMFHKWNIIWPVYETKCFKIVKNSRPLSKFLFSASTFKNNHFMWSQVYLYLMSCLWYKWPNKNKGYDFYEVYSYTSLLKGTDNFNSLWPSDDTWPHLSGSILAQVMACLLVAPGYYLNQCWSKQLTRNCLPFSTMLSDDQYIIWNNLYHICK